MVCSFHPKIVHICKIIAMYRNAKIRPKKRWRGRRGNGKGTEREAYLKMPEYSSNLPSLNLREISNCEREERRREEGKSKLQSQMTVAR
jgi:hypothetical protein